ncbi:hypothetical protein BDZ45DRAFT_741345 [Acephala macrosclerotiorum]|nr:hypothetical protein BDZ45DRAFT_741345 [Acephala macrosclerotiorum]
MKSSNILSCLLFAGNRVAHAPPVPKCNHDNPLRCFRFSTALANPYCSVYNSIPLVTVASSTVPISALTLPTIAATSTDLIYSTQVSTSVELVTATFASTIYDVLTTTDIVAQKHKRAMQNPKCLTYKTYYPPASISSACSCLSVPQSTTHINLTAPASTKTTYHSVTTVTTFTIVVSILTIETETSIETDLLTSTLYSTYHRQRP